MELPFRLLLIAFATQLGFVADLPAAEDEKQVSPPAGLEKSQWKSNDESETEIWLVKRADGSMELKGRDAASSYGGLLLQGDKPDSYICHGRGFRFIGGFPFAYRSTLSLQEKEGTKELLEKWEAIFASGETIKGETVLQFVSEE